MEGRGAGGPVPPPPPSFFFFYKNKVYEQKNGIKRVRNLSQTAGNGHFKTQIFKHFWGSIFPGPPRKLAPSALVVAPPPPSLYESLGSAPGTALVFVEDRINLFDNMFKNSTLSFPLKEYYKEISPLKCH